MEMSLSLASSYHVTTGTTLAEPARGKCLQTSANRTEVT
jgi:hypothetical protein